MKSFALTLIPLSLVLSAQLFAWPGATRPNDVPKIPVDTAKSKKTDTNDGKTIVEGYFSNRKGSNELLCDIVAQVSAKLGSDETIIKAFRDRRVLKPYREFSDRFVFDITAEAGQGYKLDKNSQRYEAACLEKTPDQSPEQMPAPHDSCDPEWNDCDWTCKADQSNPDQCGNANQDW
ncbi:MAG: hypothetical protein NTX25_03805 [Proteobacteria bacterium]|nr:hypothetical protein [Pseudomonadota bacterium]